MRATPIVIALALFALAPAAPGAGPGDESDEPDKPKPKPKLELLTETQDEAVRKQAIKLGVRSKRGDEVRAKAMLLVDSFPDDYSFRLGPESKRLRDREAKLPLKLSPRQEEVLAFAAQACAEARLEVEAKAGQRTRTGRLEAKLPSGQC